MKDNRGETIYIGKAKNLKKRLASYFHKTINDEKTQTLLRAIDSFETIITDNEIEALILESNLIKRYKPRFNIELKENNRYPYIKITKEKFPRIVKTRIKGNDSALYFGPYPNVKYINKTIKTITDIFPIRRCNRNMDKKNPGPPCLNYYLGKCICPLSGGVDAHYYQDMVDQVVLFLKGRSQELLILIKEQMEKEAREKRFELAIQLRERYRALRALVEEQKITTNSDENSDIIGIAQNYDTFQVVVLIKRRGMIIGKRDYNLKNSMSKEDILEQFLELFYEDNSDFPHTLLIPFEIPGRETIESYLKRKYGKNIKILVPKKGLKKRLVELASKNAEHKMLEELYQYNPEKALHLLKRILLLKNEPRCIEAFDISTTLGESSVASMVRFVNGMPDKKGYRKFKIKYRADQNDVEMIKEAVARRYQRLLNENKSLPDLVLIDGGKPQRNAATTILRSLGAELPVIGLAKKHEDIYTSSSPTPLTLERRNEALRLLMAIRNEAHRFARSYHIRLRAKKAMTSRLKSIPGIGDTLANTILQSLRSLDTNITPETLENIEGIGHKRAQDIYRILQEETLPKETPLPSSQEENSSMKGNV